MASPRNELINGERKDDNMEQLKECNERDEGRGKIKMVIKITI